MLVVRPRAQPIELFEKTAAWPTQVSGKHVHHAHIRHVELDHHDLAGVDAMDILAGRHIAGVRHEEIIPAQDGDAFPVAVKAEMRPIGVQIIVLAQKVANDLGRIGVPVSVAIAPLLAHLLQADDIDIEVVDSPGNLTELRILVFLLIAVQVEREDLQAAAAGHVVVAEIVVPDRPARRFAADRVLNAKCIVGLDLADPDARVVSIRVSGAARTPLVPVHPIEEAGRNLSAAPVVRCPVNVDPLGLQGVAYGDRDRTVALPGL